MQAYSDPKRETDPYALPDVEVFHHAHKRETDPNGSTINVCPQAWGAPPSTDPDGSCLGTGWYWWSCFPGCLPDSDPVGPFDTEEEALADAQANAGDEDDGDDD